MHRIAATVGVGVGVGDGNGERVIFHGGAAAA